MSAADATSSTEVVNEDDLRKELRKLRDVVQRRELPTTYNFLLTDSVVTPRKPILSKDKSYMKVIPARLRERVEAFGTMHEWDRVAQRKQYQGPLWEESQMRAALTLRDLKKHEQQELLAVTVATNQAPKFMARKAHVEAMALGLQSKELKKLRQKEESALAEREKREQAVRLREMEREELKEKQKRERAAARKHREMEEEDEMEEEQERREEERLRRAHEDSPRLKLARYLKPAFEKLWMKEFANLGHTNPFRIIITAENCLAMGAPGYGEIVKKPMNLAFIKKKLTDASYEAMVDYFNDVDLMINNALLYNSDPNNDYHLAAKEMQSLQKKLRKKICMDLENRKNRKKLSNQS